VSLGGWLVGWLVVRKYCAKRLDVLGRMGLALANVTLLDGRVPLEGTQLKPELKLKIISLAILKDFQDYFT